MSGFLQRILSQFSRNDVAQGREEFAFALNDPHKSRNPSQNRPQQRRSSGRPYEFRCPVYGFITVNDWEREIINSVPFQRLRRIRQLAFTEYIYPGATHTRFEHSLGVMHMATLLHQGIVGNSRSTLESIGFNESGIPRSLALVRLAALLHDIGHSPFSHAAEILFPMNVPENRRYRHEDYSAALVRNHLREVIENHPLNVNYRITADEIADLMEGSARAGSNLIWKELISGQLDADRMDYLLRDSHHIGVNYGKYDWYRLVNTIKIHTLKYKDDGERTRLVVSEGGWHAAESLILARYFMFTQVYYHKTRIAYDHHVENALTTILPDGTFPPPTIDGLNEYLKWDDWRVLGAITGKGGGEHGDRIMTRNHFRQIWHTKETPTVEELQEAENRKTKLGPLLAATISAEKSWYKVDSTDIPIVDERSPSQIAPLSSYSSFVSKMSPIKMISLYVRPESVPDALEKMK